jgi:hypothetical protein
MRAPRACATPGCPVVVTSGHCSAHARPGPRARGYDSQHDKHRAQLAARIQAGQPVHCWRCGQPVTTPADLDLGHDDHDRTITRGPEHQRCNRSAAGKASHTS